MLTNVREEIVMDRWIAALVMLGLGALALWTHTPDVQATPPAQSAIEASAEPPRALSAGDMCSADAANESECFFKCGQCINTCGINEHSCKAACASLGDNCCRAYGKRMRGTTACFHCAN